MKNAQLFYWAIILAFGFGLYTYKYHLYIPSPIEVDDRYFKVPRIGQNLMRQSLQPYDQDHLWSGNNHVMGKFPFTDYIYIDGEPAIFPGDDFFTPPSFWWDTREEFYPLDGLQLKIGYDTYIKGLYNGQGKAHIPVFIVNETSSTKYLYGRREYVSTMIEAKDRDGIWRPIEYASGIIGCLNGVGFIKIHPKEFCVVAVPVFRGDFKTQIRVKLKNRHSILISEAFPGQINEAQFKFKAGDRVKDSLQENPWCKFPYWFLGSVPLEFAR